MQNRDQVNSAIVRMVVSMPPEIKAWIFNEAKLAERSQNYIAVHALRAEMERRTAKPSRAK